MGGPDCLRGYPKIVLRWCEVISDDTRWWHSRWSQMIADDCRWFQLIPRGPQTISAHMLPKFSPELSQRPDDQCSHLCIATQIFAGTQMIPDEPRLSDLFPRLFSDDARWSQMIIDAPFRMEPDDPRWSQMIPDDPKMISGKPTCFQTARSFTRAETYLAMQCLVVDRTGLNGKRKSLSRIKAARRAARRF